MDIVVRGFRSSPSDWDAVEDLRGDQLPPLTPEQRATAAELHVSEEDYARSALAGQRAQQQLLTKTRRSAELLEGMLESKGMHARLQRVELDVWDERFEIVFEVNGLLLPMRIQEAIVDELFESGSADAEKRILRVLDLAFQRQEA